MKSYKRVFFTLVFMLTIMNLHAQVWDSVDYKRNSTNVKIEVIFFHKAHRCVSCRAVQIETDKALKELYPEEIKNGELVYLKYNIDDDANQELMEQFDVQSQKLLILKDDHQKELTDTAFSIIRSSHPERLKQLLRDAIDNL